MSAKTLVLSLTCLLCPLAAVALPTTNVQVHSSGITITAVNDEDRAYNCSIEFEWAQDAIDGQVVRSRVSTVAGIGPKKQDAIFRLQGSYKNVRIVSGPQIKCS